MIPKYYFNRHTSWLAFNRRVLEEARRGRKGQVYLGVVTVPRRLPRDEILLSYLKDVEKARLLRPDGRYLRPSAREAHIRANRNGKGASGGGFSVHDYFIDLAARPAQLESRELKQ